MRVNTVSYSIRCLLQKCPTPAAMTSCNPDIGGRPGAPPYRQVFRRLGEGRSRFTCPVCRGYLNPATPEATYTHKKILVSVRKTNVFSNMRSDFFSKHSEVIHQTQVTLMGKTTFLHKQFIKNGERISKSINNSRAPSIRILRGPWTVRINGRVQWNSY